MQVPGEFTQPEFWMDNDEFIDTKYTQNIIPLKNLSAVEVRITLSRDWNVSSLNSFVGTQNAVARAPQNITLVEAIKTYTLTQPM